MGFRLPNGADLSEEQLDIINLPTNKDWVIKGAPGTGKTVMAIYRAGQVCKQEEDKQVLLLVYNNPLMRYISTAVKGNDFRNVKVSTYHQWISDIYKEYKMGYPPKDGNTFAWSRVCKDLSKVGCKYSHIIIDEAQDFPIELLKILKEHTKHVTCFIDPNQAIEKGRTNTYEAIKTICVESPYTLTKNFRNSKPIRDLSAVYCFDGEPAPTNIPGKKPVAIKCIPNNFDDQNEKMAAIIKRNKEKNIGIIVNQQSLNVTYDSLKELLPNDIVIQFHKSKTSNRIDFDLTGVKIVSYGTMKGLEFDIVLLPIFDKIDMSDGGIIDSNRVYVALSRALNELYLFYWNITTSSGKVDTMTSLVENKNLVEWK